MHRSILLLACLVAALGSADALAKHFKATASGWTVVSSEADVDASLTGGSTSHSSGRSTVGPLTAGASSDLGDWDGSSYCDFDPDSGAPRGVLLHYVAFSQVVRFVRGDLMYLQLDSSPPSTLCFNFIDNTSFTVELHLTVMGGTGRFEGATGSLVSRGSGSNLSSTLSAFEAETEGQIWFSRD